MKAGQSFGRREFLKTTGEALSLFTVAIHLPSQIANATEGGSKRIKREAPHIRRLLDEMDSKGSRFWSVPQKDGELLYFIIKATRSRNVLEVGTSHGFSAIWIGLGLEETGGKLTTIEIDKERYNLARKHVNEAGLSQRITSIRGDAHVEVTKLEGPFDFVFLDADKEGQMDYFNKLFPKKLVPGGILAVHNAIRHAHSMKDYLDMIQKHPDFDTVILSVTMDDGFCLSYRHRVS
ncbi:MAG: class I SAM-dependent methyltransferase [Syntrophaceae bacterium]|nr:class I SAM-dependent methyltransferase [Syntrophaceae bacterium]